MTTNILNTESYVLPENAIIGKSWDLPKAFIDAYDSPKAPYWDLEEQEFNGYIKSVKETEKKGILLIEYWVYKSNRAHCAGYYQYWDSGKAMVDTSTHRRWNVA